jgi:hypothetical protein
MKLGKSYGCSGPLCKRAYANIHISEDSITVEISYPADHICCEILERLDKTIQFIMGYQDPFEAYILKLKEASKNYSNDAHTGLVLSKIAYVEKTIFDFFITKDNDLCLSVVSSLEAGSKN